MKKIYDKEVTKPMKKT